MATAMSEKIAYRTVTTRLRALRENSIFVDRPAARGAGEVSLPRSLIHGGDDRRLEGAFIGEEVTFRLADWKAEEIGWA